MNAERITVVYDVVNEEQFRNSNPIFFTQNGLKAVAVSTGDGLDAMDALVELCAIAKRNRKRDLLRAACTAKDLLSKTLGVRLK